MIMFQRLRVSFEENIHSVDTSVQNKGIPGVPGCLEHTGVMTQFIQEARESKEYLATIWLDLINASRPTLHKLVELKLTGYHVPTNIRNLIMDYFRQITNNQPGEGYNHQLYTLCHCSPC